MKNLDQIAVEVSKLINDYSTANPEYNFTRWCKSDLIHYAEDAIMMLSMLMPKKFTKVMDIPLSAGNVQIVPDDCTKITKILGVKDKFGVLSSITSSGDDRLSALFTNVCAAAVDSSVYKMTGYSSEETSDKVYFVQPPVLASQLPVSVTVICTAAPSDIDKDYTPASWMHNAIVEWMQYRAYSSEDESTSSPQVAATHLEHFYAIIANFKQAETEMTLSSKGTTNATGQ